MVIDEAHGARRMDEGDGEVNTLMEIDREGGVVPQRGMCLVAKIHDQHKDGLAGPSPICRGLQDVVAEVWVPFGD